MEIIHFKSKSENIPVFGFTSIYVKNYICKSNHLKLTFLDQEFAMASITVKKGSAYPIEAMKSIFFETQGECSVEYELRK
ncbi:MAG TPA: hypothetical protein VK179_13900 [Bacteroidales bacterium]|nr:hypothetical protein [Bacteroidales bacterium]